MRKSQFVRFLCRSAAMILALCLALWAAPVESDAAGNKAPMICLSTEDGQNAEYITPGIPCVIDTGMVLCLSDFYEGEGLSYLAVDADGNAYSLEYVGKLFGMSVFSTDAEDLGPFYERYASPQKGAQYTMLGLDNNLSYVQCKVTVTQVSSQKNSIDTYDITLDGIDKSIVPPAVVVQGNSVIAFYTGSRVFSMGQPSDSPSEGPSEGPSESPTESPSESPTESPSNSTSESPSESTGSNVGRKHQGEEKSPVLLYAACGLAAILLVVGIFVILWIKNASKPTPQPVPQPVPQPTPQPAPRPEPKPTEPKCVELYLEAIGGPLSGQLYPIQGAGLLIGRSMEANIRFPEDTKGVSRKHCRVFWNNGTLQVVDLGSTAGTYLSGKGKLVPNVPSALREGDAIYLGSKIICLRLCSRAK